MENREHQQHVWPGLRRGWGGRCPACGHSKLFSAYLKIVAECPACGLHLSQYRADDGPAYFTILIVGHFLIGPLLFIEAVRTWPVEIISAIVVPVIIVAALLLLPRIKGAFVGLQWAIKDRSGV